MHGCVIVCVVSVLAVVIVVVIVAVVGMDVASQRLHVLSHLPGTMAHKFCAKIV